MLPNGHGVDPTRVRDNLPEAEFALDLPGRGLIAGRLWNSGGTAGTIGILHGLGDHAGRYGRAVEALAAEGFRVEAIDLPGHGKSYGARGHVESWDDYRAAIDAWWARPREGAGAPVALLGHSMGCLAALDFTLARPGRVRAVVLSAPPFELVLRVQMLKVRLAQLIVRLWPSFSQQTTILPSMLSRDPDVVRAHNADPLVHYRMSARLFFEFTATNTAMRRAAPRLPIPALLLHGTSDAISNHHGSERWANEAPPGLATLRLFPGFYHEILNEPEGPSVARELAGWLRATLA
jgi:lysophospholipase